MQVWGVSQRRIVNSILRNALVIHAGTHFHSGTESLAGDITRVIKRGCNACYSQNLSFGFAIRDQPDQNTVTQENGPLSQAVCFTYTHPLLFLDSFPLFSKAH